MRIHWELCLGAIFCLCTIAPGQGQTPPTTRPSEPPPANVQATPPGPENPAREPREGREGREMRFWVPEHHHALEKAAYLGLTASPVTAALREQLKLQKGFGMVVDFVEPGSPAEAAGIKRYDVLQNFNDQILIDSYQLAILIRSFKPGDEIKLTVLHQGQSQVVSAKLIEKEVEVLDENNPGGMPPMPWGRAEGIEQHYFPGPGPGEGPHGRPTSRPSDRR